MRQSMHNSGPDDPSSPLGGDVPDLTEASP